MPRSAKWAAGAFLAGECLLYLWFLSVDLWGEGSSNPVKYASILLCLAFSLLGAAAWGGERLVCLALGLTAWADWYLLVLNRHYALGVGIFCGVQLCYLVRLRRESGGRSWWGARLALVLGALAGLAALGQLTALNVLVALYFTGFLCNAGLSLTLSGRRMRLFSLGLVLFLCCDVWVGVFNAPGLLPDGFYAFARVGMWLFYLPAQVLIALSALPGAWFGGMNVEK